MRCKQCGKPLFKTETAGYCYLCWRRAIVRIDQLLALGVMGTFRWQ